MEKTELKKSKKTFSILEIAATDKENLSSKVHRKKTTNINTSKTSLAKRNKSNKRPKELQSSTVISDTKNASNLAVNVNNARKDQTTTSGTVLNSDLTIDNPSENYWRNLAESCRKALDIALKENVDLHNKVNELEYENSRLKTMLNEAKSLVEVLTEMIEEKTDESQEYSRDDSVLEETKGKTKEPTSDSEYENGSFHSC